MFADLPMHPNLVTTDIANAKAFYVERLGLQLIEDMGEALLLQAGQTPVFIYRREQAPHSDATVASWTVPDIEATVKELQARDIHMERYEGFDQDALGIASRGEGGPKAAWFKDPDGNILGLTQLAS